MITIKNEEGVEMEVFTQAEMKEQQDKITELNGKLTARGEDFSQMSKKLEKVDEFEKKIGGLEQTLADKEKQEKINMKNSAFEKWHGGKEDLKTGIENAYAKLAGMPESTLEEVALRANEAAKLAGFSVDSRNPLYSGMSGEAPRPRVASESTEAKEAEFFASDRGQAALKAAGLSNPVKPADPAK
jgi:uncharacterized coiled-coil protein SlyX